MAEAVILPKLGNTVESAIILAWRVAVGDAVAAGDVICEIETDKATLEVESTVSGVLLARFFEEGVEAPVLTNIAAVGAPGESFAELAPSEAVSSTERIDGDRPDQPSLNQPDPAVSISAALPGAGQGTGRENESVFVSPRARRLAERKGIDYRALSGSGPQGRIIERDVAAAIDGRVSVTPVAQAMLDSGDFQLGQGATKQRVTKADLVPADERGSREIPLKGVRKTIAERMLASTQSTAQFTLNASADASALQAFRRRLKDSDERLGLRDVKLNDLLLLAVARSLPAFPALNAHFAGDTITQFDAVHLALAVDTDRGLLAPVIRDADRLSLKRLAGEAQRLAQACRTGTIAPDELRGGTFTVSNLGALGIESFTPLLNPPQVAILGVGAISLKPVQRDGEVEFAPHISLSLTINHQVVDGAPAARFLGQLAINLKQIDLLALS